MPSPPPKSERRRRPPLHLATAIAVASGTIAVAIPTAARAQARAPAGAAAAAASAPSIVIRADTLRGRPDLDAVAEGNVELRRGPLELKADRLTYDQPEDLATARGNVRIRNPIGVYSGPELQLHVQRFEGFFLQPEYEITRLAAGGRAARIDFLDSARSVAIDATYTSCPRDGSGDPAWVLETRRVRLDLDADEGVAEGAVLRFLGVPILAAPTLSFPLGEARKSGWLPPSIDFDTKSGLTLAVPHYWNLAPNRDATLVPRVITRRGVGLDAEFRYLERDFGGRAFAELLPNDRVADRSRWAGKFEHDGALPAQWHWHADVTRVSDDGWWKEFPNHNRSLTPRLLPLEVFADRRFAFFGGDGHAYARVLRWQVLQDAEAPIVSPYERSPQIGARLDGSAPWQLDYSLVTEANRFTLPDREGHPTSPTGWRLHALSTVSRTWRAPGWWLTPRLRVNAASYSTDQPLVDGRRRSSRVIPTFSVDGGMEFERTMRAFGRELRQTLEPRVLFVHTPFRDQSSLPNFDSAAKDFNYNSIYSDNAFSGIDRVSDAQQLTAGVTTRLIDPASGVEALRLGIVQRFLFRDQRVTPEGTPFTQRFSDLYLIGSTGVIPKISLDGALQYNTELERSVRAVVSATYSPGPFRTVSTTYRLTRGLAEQLEVGWQWPLWKSSLAAAEGRAAAASPVRSSSTCRGTWYSVGRVNYSLRDSRITDSILGFEYDAGCWIGRIVAERISTGRSEATTRVLLQLELVGLSRLGSNPLRVLKENVPGYRLLREEQGSANPPVSRYE